MVRRTERRLARTPPRRNRLPPDDGNALHSVRCAATRLRLVALLDPRPLAATRERASHVQAGSVEPQPATAVARGRNQRDFPAVTGPWRSPATPEHSHRVSAAP